MGAGGAVGEVWNSVILMCVMYVSSKEPSSSRLLKQLSTILLFSSSNNSARVISRPFMGMSSMAAG